MPDAGRRVVLLARPGGACERLRAALHQVGAQLVLEADPTRLEPADLAAAAPEVVLVALDAASEQAIERFDAVLNDPAIDVMFEEADVAANREGWDAARWIRHLAAKLHRHDDVLPPGTETGAAPMLASAIGAQPADASDDLAESAAPLAEPVPAHPLSEEFTSGVEPGGYGSFDPVAAELADVEQNADQVIAFDFRIDESLALDGFATSDVRLDEFDAANAPVELVFESELVLPTDDGLLATPMANAEPGASQFDALQFDPTTLDDLRGADATASFAGMTLELADDDAPTAHAPVGGGARFATDLDALEQRISSLELVDDRPEPDGAVLVVAGIGGPDAVRQLLGALPGSFSRPVLVQLRLDGGRYDKLVTQMQRATSLPVELAAAGSIAYPGIVYVLPPALGVRVQDEGLRFDQSVPPLAGLPRRDSAVLLLSGSDATLVEELTTEAWSHAFVAGQAPDGCYDAAAPSALAARGGLTGQPAELAQRLAARWGSP